MIHTDAYLSRTDSNNIVNHDRTGYAAAKLRRQRESYISGLEVRINKLEDCVNCLQQTLEEIRNK